MRKNLSKKDAVLCAAAPAAAVLIWAFSAWYETKAELFAAQLPISGGVSQQLLLLKNSALLFSIFAIGFLLLWLLREENSLFDILVLSFPVGMGYVFAVCFVILNLNIRFCIASVLIGTAAGLAAVAVFCRKRAFKPRNDLRAADLIFAFSIVAILCVLCCAFPLRAFSDDSVHHYTLCPRIIAASGSLPYYYSHCFVSVGLLEPLVAAAGYLFSAFIPFGLQNALGVCMFAYITRRAASAFGGARLKRFALPLAGIAVLCCVIMQPALLMLQFYLWSNFFGAAYLFFSAVLVDRIYGKAAQPENEIALMIVLLGFAFTRLEGFAYALPFVLILARGEIQSKKLFTRFLLPPTAFYCLYFFNLYVVHGVPDNPRFLSRGYAAAILAMYLAVAAYTLLLRDKDFLKMRSEIWKYLIAGFVALAALGTVIYPERVSVYASSILHNTLSAESWGTGGAVIIVAYIATLIWSRFRVTVLDICAAAFPLTVLVICIYIKGAGTNPFDSSNRLLIQVIPLVCLAIAEKLNNNREKDIV